MRERLINRRQQGDLGEASAIERLTRQGANVSVPLGHSPDYDLIAAIDSRLLRVQVKTCSCRTRTPDGHERWSVQIATLGGNQSWSGLAKTFDATRVDYLFALVGDGRRWMIPAPAIEAVTKLSLGGQKYSEFEVAAGSPLERFVYGATAPALQFGAASGECPSGQRELTVNQPATPTQVRILPPPSSSSDRPKYEGSPGRLGEATIWRKRRLTIPLRAFDDAQLAVGERLRVRADGPGRVILTRIESRSCS